MPLHANSRQHTAAPEAAARQPMKNRSEDACQCGRQQYFAKLRKQRRKPPRSGPGIRRRSIFLYKCSEIRCGKESDAEKLTQHHTRDYKLHAETRFALHCKSTVRRKAFQQQPNKKNRAVCSVISLKAVVRTRPAAICTDFRMFSVPVKNMHIKTSGIAPSVLQSPMRRSAIDLRSINAGTAESKTARRTQAVHSASGCECPDLPLRSAAQQR